jgi:hypothetical protein
MGVAEIYEVLPLWREFLGKLLCCGLSDSAKTFAPDWRMTTQTEQIPAAKVAEMGIERKMAWIS